MGLIAREIEHRGIPTLSMSSARSITAAVAPPRAVFLDYPLGHTAGRANDPANQLRIMRDTLQIFESIDRPGSLVDLGYQWQPDDAWKERVMRPDPDRPNNHDDDRVARHATPQYQSEEDARAADPDCPTCVFLG